MQSNDNQKQPVVMRWPRICGCTPHADGRGYRMTTPIWPFAKPGRTFKAVVRRRRPAARRQISG